MNIIQTKSLAKYYRRNRAIEDLSLDIPKNSIFGLLGCNGAGKTTTLSILAGLVRKTKGVVIIDSMDLDKQEDKIKSIMGIMPQNMLLYPFKTSFQNMLFYASLRGMKKQHAKDDINALFREFGLEDAKNMLAKNLSHGQAKLILILQAFLNEPKIIILDEPISGFDPKRMIQLREFIRKKSRKSTIIISSHNLDEIDRLCTHIAIIHQGKLIRQGRKQSIKKGKTLEKVFIESI